MFLYCGFIYTGKLLGQCSIWSTDVWLGLMALSGILFMLLPEKRP